MLSGACRFVSTAVSLLLYGFASAGPQPHLLNLDTGSLQTAATAAGVQDLQLDASQRGVTAGAAARVASPFGWALNADAAAVDEVGLRYFGPIDLATGAVTYSDSQLVLPAHAPWPIGISYNSAQTSAHVSNGQQGKNWFQNSQPSITAPDSNGIVRLFYAANAFTEYKRVDSTSYYAGINGAGGVLKISTVTSENPDVEIYTLDDQAGNEIVFFGFSSSIAPSSAQGQIWKYTTCKDTATGTQATAYVYSATSPYAAAKYGYSNGRILTAFDSAGHQFNYGYTATTVGGASRLTSVTATTGGGSPTTIATVEYAYYGDATIANSTTNNGAAGDLARVRVTLPTSFPAAGADPAILDVRENRFYYDTNSRLKLILGYEGTRRHLVAAGGSPVSWDANSTTLGTALNSLAELRVVYSTVSGSTGKVASAWFAGMDGNNDQPSGEHVFAFEGNGAYTTAWQSRAIVKLPAFDRYAGTSFASPGEASGNVWMTQYFDDLEQPLHSVVSDMDPSGPGGSTPKCWVTGVVRDADHRLKAVHTPANCYSYIHNATNSTHGSYSTRSSEGEITYFERYGSGSVYEGMVNGTRRGAGVGTAYGSTNYVSYAAHTMRDVTLFSGSPTVKLMRPMLDYVRTYPVATTSPTTSGSYNTTSYAYTWWEDTTAGTYTIVPRTVTTTLPAVALTHNGSGVSNTTKTWFSHLGQAIVNKMPNGRLNSSEYDSATGLLVKQTTDDAVPSFADLPSGDMPTLATISGESTPYEIETLYARDVLGRVTQTTEGSRVSQSYYTRLSDRRIVRMDVPAVTLGGTPTYYGPVSAVVVNHLGVTEEGGQISLSNPTAVQDSAHPSRFYTTSSPRTWLAAPGSLADEHLTDVVQDTHSAGLPELVTFSYLALSADGSRVVEARRYTLVPTTGLGAPNTNGNNYHYDRSLTHYNGMGLVDREQDFTNTIYRSSFDAIGRVIRQTRGTDESVSASNNMRPVSSIVYDSSTYDTSTAELNVAGGNGQVTEIWRHPSGSFGGAGDTHSYIRYDALGNAVNLWSDEGPFLASAVDNLGRVTAAAAFNGALSTWNAATSPFAPTVTDTGGTQYRQRFAQNFYDELGRVFQQANHAVNPNSGVESSLSGADTVRTDYYRGANGTLKFVSGAAQTQIATNRLCQRTSMSAVCLNYDASTNTFTRYGELTSGNMSNQVTVAQTVYCYDNDHRNVISTISAERGTANVTSGGVSSTGPSSPRGPLIGIPSTPAAGWLSLTPPAAGGGIMHWECAPNIDPSRLLLNVRTIEHDQVIDIPIKYRDFGDPFRHGSPFEDVNCTPGNTNPFPSGVWPYKETEVRYDPRRALCKTVSTDWESGDRSVTATFTNAAGQVLHSMAIKHHVDPSEHGYVDFPPVPADQAPLIPTEGGCCNTADRVDNEFDKGRIKLERMFMCDLAGDPAAFDPLNAASFCGSSSSCPKATSHGYPDLVGFPSGAYPWGAESDTAPRPNDNNRELWTIKPIGGDPSTGWNVGAADGKDDADWFVYDDLGRMVRRYDHAYRKSNFGDGNAVTGYPSAQQFEYNLAGRPMTVRTPSGNISKPWEHQFLEYDGLGRPKKIKHVTGASGLPSTTTADDTINFKYDSFGLIGEYSQVLPGMLPSGCGGNTLVCGIVREGTPQQAVNLGGNPLTPWQGPRVVRQTLPVPNMEVGMAYFPDPLGTTDSTMFPAAASGYVGQLVEPRLDWALGRTHGIYQGDGTKHYDEPVSRYGYVGMAIPLHRSLPGAGDGGFDKWQMLPTDVAPGSPYGAGGGFVPLDRHAPDWQHRYRDDIWSHPIDVIANPLQDELRLEVEGHEDIKWMSGRITSMKDPATSPDFVPVGGVVSSPVTGFNIFGHDEYFRHDCKGRMLYWLSGQTSQFSKVVGTTPYQAAEEAWKNGLTSPTGVNTVSASKTGAVLTEAEFRWPTPPTGCATTGGQGGWMIAPDGRFNVDHPLSPKDAGGGTEWAQHAVSEGGGCPSPAKNSRTEQQVQKATVSGSVSTVGSATFTYDAAGNLRFDGRHYYQYDGRNRLTDVFDHVAGVQSYRRAHFEYDGLGRHLSSRYDTDGDSSSDLSDEDTEWTPRDLLGRPLGIWRQRRATTEEPTPCGRPYQLFGYHSTGFRGTGFDASGGILDCPAVRWRDANGDEEDGLEEKLYYLQDFRGDVTALVEPGTGIVEHVRYGPTGRPEAFPVADVNFDGKVDAQDESDYLAAALAFKLDHADYDPRADLDRSGGVGEGSETGMFYDSFDKFNGLSGNWKLSQGAGLLPAKAFAEGYDNRFGWRGYWYDKRLQEYHVRHRVYDPRQGQWLQTDPIGFAAGDQNLYRYADGGYSTGYDPLGLYAGESLVNGLRTANVLLNPLAGLIDREAAGWASDGLRELGDLFSGRAQQQDQQWAATLAKAEAGCWKTARKLREAGETERASDVECTCQDMRRENANAIGQVAGLRMNEWKEVGDTSRNVAAAAISLFTGGTSLIARMAIGAGVDMGVEAAAEVLWNGRAPEGRNIAEAGIQGAVGGAAAWAGVRVFSGFRALDLSRYAGPGMPKYLASTAREHSVYLGQVNRGGRLVNEYVGMTTDITQRTGGHGSRFAQLRPIGSGLTEVEARAIEQALKNRNPHWQNVANSISPSHPFYQEAMRWAEQWLRLNGY